MRTIPELNSKFKKIRYDLSELDWIISELMVIYKDEYLIKKEIAFTKNSLLKYLEDIRNMTNNRYIVRYLLGDIIGNLPILIGGKFEKVSIPQDIIEFKENNKEVLDGIHSLILEHKIIS